MMAAGWSPLRYGNRRLFWCGYALHGPSRFGLKRLVHHWLWYARFYCLFLETLNRTQDNYMNATHAGIRLGIFNAGGATKKGAGIEDVIRDHKLDRLLLNETWIRHDAPAAAKFDIAPDNYSVLHTHRRQPSDRRRVKRGGGLALVHSHNLDAKIINCDINPSTFELQITQGNQRWYSIV